MVFNFRLTCLYLFLTGFAGLKAQNQHPKLFFDKTGKSCPETNAYYYRQESDTSGFFRSWYLSNGRLNFQGRISNVSESDENKNTYSGLCYWYYKNGNAKAIRAFAEDGTEKGLSKYYFESGKIQKEIEYENGRVKDNTFFEYDEDGSRNCVFEENFNNNLSEWDLYLSDKSFSAINNGFFELESLGKQGSSRFINVPVGAGSYAIESSIRAENLKENDKVGLIYGFKDWSNYNYFCISKKYIYIGSVYEGINAVDVDAMYCSAILPLENNVLKVISNGEKNYYSVNGEVQYSDDANRFYGNNFGFVVSGNSRMKADNLLIKQIAVSSIASSNSASDQNVKATGSGVIISSTGYLLTNHHVVENSQKFVVEINTPNSSQEYKAELVKVDKENDLAVLKINDPAFKNMENLRYAFKESGTLEVGSSVFTLGYPLALNGMGKEVKFTDGKISAKTGYEGAMNTFQTTVPVQPGNSGGPVFNNQGQLIGVINASVKNTDNVSYAVKLNYIRNLIEVLNESLETPSDNSIANLPLEEKIRILSKYVVLIKVK
ncbi:MAG TPA: trypsin-like peptidase domain-containing protein [Bacteroidia bacterium]|nr:trypsin-like peptidase domain-containing protein [Bacteroidia bacterium]